MYCNSLIKSIPVKKSSKSTHIILFLAWKRSCTQNFNARFGNFWVVYSIQWGLDAAGLILAETLPSKPARQEQSKPVSFSSRNTLFPSTYQILYRGRKEKCITNLLAVTEPAYPSGFGSVEALILRLI